LPVVRNAQKHLKPSRIGRCARDQGLRSGFWQKIPFEKIASLFHQLSTTGGPLLRPLRIWGGEWGSAECFYAGRLESHL